MPPHGVNVINESHVHMHAGIDGMVLAYIYAIHMPGGHPPPHVPYDFDDSSVLYAISK